MDAVGSIAGWGSDAAGTGVVDVTVARFGSEGFGANPRHEHSWSSCVGEK